MTRQEKSANLMRRSIWNINIPPPNPPNPRAFDTFPSPGSGAFDLKNWRVGHLTNTAECRECENDIFIVTRTASDVKMWHDIGEKDICFVTGSGKVCWRNKRALLRVSVMTVSLVCWCFKLTGAAYFIRQPTEDSTTSYPSATNLPTFEHPNK